MKSSILLAASATLLASSAFAQTNRVIPTVCTTTEGNDLGSYPFGRATCRSQQIWEGTSLGTATALINAMAYRADNDNSIGSSVTSFSSVQVSVSTTTVSPAAMSTTFASNITGTPTVVFNGPLSLPAYTSTERGVAPFAAQLPFSTPVVFLVPGNHLLVDTTTSGANPTSPSWVMDSMLPGGVVRGIGLTGTTSGFDNLQLLVSANGPLSQGRFEALIPGGSIILFAQANRVFTGGMMFGATTLATPFDLGTLGAPGNFVYIQPAVTIPFVMTSGGIAIRASFPLTVPAVPGYVGSSVYAQAYVADAPANTLGIVTTRAVEMTIGQAGPHMTRQLNATVPTSMTGTYQYVSGILGGPVCRFSGVFN